LKLNRWTGDGVYAQLFDRETSAELDKAEDIICYDIDGLKDSPELQTAVAFTIARAIDQQIGRKDANGALRPTRVVIESDQKCLGRLVEEPADREIFRVAGRLRSYYNSNNTWRRCSMVELKVRKFGNSLGVVLPKEVINRLHTGDGEPLFLIEAPEGGYRLTPYDPSFEKKMAKADDIISRYRNTLHVLAK
jgi:putative addiction module antidote